MTDFHPTLRCVKQWVPLAEEIGQTEDFSIAVDKQNYPVIEVSEGQTVVDYPHGEPSRNEVQMNKWTQMTEEERRLDELNATVDYSAIRRAAEAHRQTRRYVQSIIHEGMSTLDLCKKLESKSASLISAAGLDAGRAFPTGVSLDHVAAHYSPNYDDPRQYLTKKSIMKLDYGVHVGGRIVDCAFTVAFDDQFDPLIQSTIDATNTAIKHAGIDKNLGEIGEVIEEVISSYEVEIDGKVYPVLPIGNLSGHNIRPYEIHGGKSVPMVGIETKERMQEGEVYAVETFASTGKGYVWCEGPVSHYMMNKEWMKGRTMRTKTGGSISIRSPLPKVTGAKHIADYIEKQFSSLPWCKRWLEDSGVSKSYKARVGPGFGLKGLVKAGVVDEYPPLVDVVGSYSSQMEHTLLMRPTCTEIVSRGDDY